MSFAPFRLILIILLSAAAVVAVVLLVAQDQETIRLRSAVSAEDLAHPAYVSALVGSDLTRGNRYDVLTNGDQIFPPMLAAINAATTRVVFETYVYDQGTVADQFTGALERAARRGVTVIVVVDAVGAIPMERSHIERLERAGALVRTFNSARWWNVEEINYRTHRKILVVDGTVGFTGGAGVADHWLGNAQDAERWRDTQVRIEGPLVRLLEAGFFENLIETVGPIAPILAAEAEAYPDEGAAFIVRSSTSGGANDLKRLYLLAIASASRTIDIASPYFMVDSSTLWSLEDARRRGVRVRSSSRATSPTRCRSSTRRAACISGCSTSAWRSTSISRR